jgi:hypothetical protein
VITRGGSTSSKCVLASSSASDCYDGFVLNLTNRTNHLRPLIHSKYRSAGLIIDRHRGRGGGSTIDQMGAPQGIVELARLAIEYTHRRRKKERPNSAILFTQSFDDPQENEFEELEIITDTIVRFPELKTES